MVETLQSLLTEVALPLIGAVVSVLVGLAVKKLANWLDFKALREYRDDIQNVAYDAVMMTEKAAKQWAKSEGEDMTSDVWYSQAIRWVQKNAPELNEEDAKGYIDSALEFIGVGDEEEKDSK